MRNIQIDLDLSRHCIETALHRRYNQDISRCLRAEVREQDLEDEITLLKSALESFDFGFLRSNWPELGGRTKKRKPATQGKWSDPDSIRRPGNRL